MCYKSLGHPWLITHPSLPSTAAVCQECIPQSEWAKFVSPALVEKYNAFNQPYRPFSRFCQDCDNELVACKHENSNRMCRET